MHTLKERLDKNKKTNESSSWQTIATLVQNKPTTKMTSSQPNFLDGRDLACWQDQQLLSTLLGNTLTRFTV